LRSAGVFAAAFAIRTKAGLQYRVPAVAGIATQFFWGLMLIMVYSAFYAGSKNYPASLPQAVSYVWLQQAFLYAFGLWIYDQEIAETIRTGQIAYELTRPRSLYVFWLAKTLGQRISGVMLRFPPVVVIASVLPSAYRLSPPAGLAALGFFIIALFLGMLVTAAYTLIAYLTLFYFQTSTVIMQSFSLFAQFLAGQFVPILFFPERAQRVLYALPFAYVNDFAIRIYTGEYGAAFIARGLFIQAAWILVLGAAGLLMLKSALKRTVAHGG